MSFVYLSAIELGFIYALVALGVYLSFRVIHFPDLTVDGTFPLGAAVAAALLVQQVNPMLATLAAMLSGMAAGCMTGYMQQRLRILGLLAGILTMTALYSVNIRIMGRPNIALLDVPTLFSNATSSFSIVFSIVVFMMLALLFFLLSQYGLGLRAAGQNPRMAAAYGVNTTRMTLLALALSNGLVALAGALFAQLQGFADVSLGTGTLVVGLASVIIGETLLGKRKIYLDLLACLLGAVIYRLVIAFALNNNLFGLQASDLNLITAALIVITLAIPRFRMFYDFTK
jgi:putative ABC transport system permease protein